MFAKDHTDKEMEYKVDEDGEQLYINYDYNSDGYIQTDYYYYQFNWSVSNSEQNYSHKYLVKIDTGLLHVDSKFMFRGHIYKVKSIPDVNKINDPNATMEITRGDISLSINITDLRYVFPE